MAGTITKFEIIYTHNYDEQNLYLNSSITINWETSAPVDRVNYFYNDISKLVWWENGAKTKGTIIIGDLVEGTTYSIAIEPRFEDGTYVKSDEKTFEIPYATPIISNIKARQITINEFIVSGIKTNFETDKIEFKIIQNETTTTYIESRVADPLVISSYYLGTAIYNIQPNTTYNVSCRVKRTNIEKWSDFSNEIVVTTLSTPSLSMANSSSSFNIGDAIELTVNNYQNITSTITFQTYVNGSWETIGDSYSGDSSTLTITPDASTLYSKTPDSNTLKTRLVCSCSNNSKNYSSYLNLNAKVTDADPTLSSFSVVTNYKTLTDIPSVLGDRKLLLGQGDVYVNIPSGSVTAQKGATIVKYAVYKQKSEGGGLYGQVVSKTIDPVETNERIEIEVPLSSFDKTGLYNLFVRFYDSRGNSVDSTYNNNVDAGYAVTVLPYHVPYITPKVIRTDGFGETLDIDMIVQIASVMQDGTMKNTIKSIKLICTKIADDTSQSLTLSSSDYTVIDTGNENEYRVTYFAQPSSAFTVNEDDVYDFRIEVTDNFTNTYSTSLTVSKAKSLFSMYNEGFVTVNKKEPDFDSPATFQVGGDIMFQSEGEDVLLSERLSNLDTQTITNADDISTLKESVTTNTNNISTNTKNIATNKSNISTNKTNISKNTTNIANLQTDVDDMKTKFVDYIIEENVDASTGHRYRIWKSGMKECWFGFKVSTAINTTWGNGYRSGALSSEAYPVPFNGSPIVLMNVKGSTADSTDAAQLMMYNSGTQYKPPSFYLVRPAALTTSTTFSIQGYAFGV